MVQDFTAFRKISFQTVDVEVALAEIEYQYLKFVCEATLRNSDEVLREQIRHLQIAGLPSFDEWRKQEIEAVRGILSPSIEATTIPTTAIESNDSAVETVVEPQSEKTSDRTSTEAPTRKTRQTKAKDSGTTQPETVPSDTTNTLVKSLSEPETAKLTSREVIEQQHEQLTVLLKEGKTMDDLAALLTSNGAKISASTLRNYLSAARRKAKAGNATAKKKASPVATPPDAAEHSSNTASDVAVETSAAVSTEPAIAEAPVEPAIAEAPIEPAIAPPKPARGRPKTAAKSKLERETSVTSAPTRKASTVEHSPQTPVLRRRKGRI